MISHAFFLAAFNVLHPLMKKNSVVLFLSGTGIAEKEWMLEANVHSQKFKRKVQRGTKLETSDPQFFAAHEPTA